MPRVNRTRVPAATPAPLALTLSVPSVTLLGFSEQG